MSSFFANHRTCDLTIPARLALIVVLAVGLSLPLVPAPVAAQATTVRYVTPGGGGDCSTWGNACTLQTALTAATAGDEIWVAEGTYTPGTDRTATFQLESGVGVYGGFGGTETARDERDWAAHPTVLSGDIGTPGDNSDNVYHVVTGSGTDASAVLDGFTVSGGNADGTDPHNGGGGMCNDHGSPTLTNVTFSGNSAVGGGGMYNWGSSPTLTNVTFSGNSAASWGGGMCNVPGSRPRLTNVTFSGNSASHFGGGMYNYDFSRPVLTNCILWGNTAPQGAQIYNTMVSPTVTYSDVQGGHAGTGNIDADPRFVDADGADDVAGTLDDNLRLRLHITSPAIDAGDNSAVPAGITTDLDGNPRFMDVDAVTDTGNGTAPIVDMGAYETRLLYVKWDATGADNGSSWTDAYTDLQSALSTAGIGDEIWVAEGTYTPGTDRTATFQLKSGVGVYGGFAGTETARGERDWAAHPAVLSGDIGTPGDNSDNAYHVVTGSATDASAVLDGFTVSGGNASGSSPNYYGGGMYNDDGSPTLTNVTFSGNSASYGGGMYNDDGSSPVLTNVTFSGNSASYDGGGMYNYDSSSPVLTNVTFSANSSTRDGGGMINDYYSSPRLTNVTFSGNSASSDGGGMGNLDSNPTLTNVTFSGNSADDGGGMYNAWSNPTLTNCILWGNTADSGPQIHNNSSNPTVTYSDIQGGYADTGNISADPLFVDADGPDDIAGTLDDNLRLHATSPAVDAGDNTAVPAGVTTDLGGNLRFTDVAAVADTGNGTAPIVDMGAYEAGLLYVKWDAAGANDGSSWTDAYTDLQSALGAAISGDEIWVAEGTYTPGTVRTDSFTLKSGVGVYGGFAGTETAPGERDWAAYPTVLSGDNDAYHVVTGSGTDASAVLDGFTVSGGNANGSYSNGRGGGMYNGNGSPTLIDVTFSGNSASSGGGVYNGNGSPTLTDVTFSGNSASHVGGGGGGMFNASGSNPRLTTVTFSGNSAGIGGGMYNEYSNPRLTNVTFSGNSAGEGGGMGNEVSNPRLTNVTFSGNSAAEGGGMYDAGGSPTLTNVTFSGNSASRGGGMCNDHGSPTLTNVTFSGNSASDGGGMYNYDSSPTLTDVTFSGNSAASWGGGMCNVPGSSPRLTNVTFSGNSANFGGGMFNYLGHPRLTNVTFSGNSANFGGGMYNIGGSPTLTNCILWGNTAPQGAQIYDTGGSPPTVTYSDVQGGYPGEGNIDADPLFVDALDDNLRLRAGSPAIDAGDNDAVPAGVTTDLDGNPRITGAAVDMGAYEVGRLYHVFLPLVSRNYAVAPDLIVERITATGNDVQVVVKNQGNAPVTAEFWVEAYVDPHPAPSAVNQLWYDLCDQGMFWGVVSPALPLAPGEAITLTYGDGYYWPSVSRFDEALPAGTPVYAQVDAYNAATTYGAVMESHEILGGEYNNVAGPVYSTGAASRRGQPGAETRATGQPQDVSRTNLPPLPGQ